MARSHTIFTDLLLPRRARQPARRYKVRPQDSPAIQEIWAVIARIPCGMVSTYGAVARAAGLPGRARLAGLALKLLPKEMNLPWHRVVGAGGRIAFPRSSRQFREQAARLRCDGVAVKGGRVNRSIIADPEIL